MFRFKQFDIIQAKNAMKVGTDSVLLGAWCSVEHAEKVLDIGTGTGLLSLMIAQRNDKVRIDAVEIDAEAAEEATLNVANSKFNSAIEVFNTSIQDFVKHMIKIE